MIRRAKAGVEIRQFCRLDEAGNQLLKAAMRQMQLSARGYDRILKPARTIAELAGSEVMQMACATGVCSYGERRWKRSFYRRSHGLAVCDVVLLETTTSCPMCDLRLQLKPQIQEQEVTRWID